MNRVTKPNYYLDIAATVLKRSTCLRKRYGAIIVKNDAIVSTGYNGAPRGRDNCIELGFCVREQLNIPRGERYELCRALHAEQNAIINASRDQMLGATLYLVGEDSQSGALLGDVCSCAMCKRMIINAGITTLVVRDTKNDFRVIDVQTWIDDDDSLSGVFGY